MVVLATYVDVECRIGHTVDGGFGGGGGRTPRGIGDEVVCTHHGIHNRRPAPNNRW